MDVLKCVIWEESIGGKKQNTYAYTFQNVLPISIGQFAQYLYILVKKWEPNILNIATEGKIETTNNVDEAKEQVFRKSYNACSAAHLLTVNRSYISICNDCFSEYVGDELCGKNV